MGHRSIKRIAHRTAEELYATWMVMRALGPRAAWTSFLGKLDIQIIARNGRIERPIYKRRLLKKHAAMERYFAKTCPMSEACKQAAPPEQNEEYRDCIWLCWWQGEKQAPPIVRACLHSIRQNAGAHKVVLITDENCRDFVQFPDWLEEKYRKGVISKTHLSDILRLKLLAQYGGVWLDATFYCTASLETCFSSPVWSIKRPDYRHTSPACGMFANYSFGCNTENREVFAILAEYVLQYWRTHDYMVDYLFLDYLIVQAQKQDPRLERAFQEILPNNPACDELLKILGKKYDQALWQTLRRDTGLFKLTWKTAFPQETDGEKTFYGKLIAGELV